MKKPVQDEQQEKETLVDWLKGIGLDGEHSDIDYNEIRDYFED